MSLRWPDSPAWQALREAVAPGLRRALVHLPTPQGDWPAVVDAGPDAAEAGCIDARGIVLDPRLTGPALYLPEDARRAAEGAPDLALDRFRRATGALLEGLAAWALAEATDCSPASAWGSWHLRGQAALAVDTAAPALGWLLPAAADLLAHPEQSLAAHPRRAAWWHAWWRTHSGDPAGVAPLPVDPAAWAAFGAWCRDRSHGPASRAAHPLPLAAPHPAQAPWQGQALSHRPLQLGGRPAGTRLAPPDGTALHPPGPFAAAEQPVVVAGVVDGGPQAVAFAPAGPVGTWRLVAGSFGSRVGSARGVELQLCLDGRAHLTGADAFLGPPTRQVLALAEQYGVSGSATGTWLVEGVDRDGRGGTLRLRGLHRLDVTVHPRSGAGFALPADAWLQPVQAALQALEARPIHWSASGPSGGRSLETRVQLDGVEVQLQFSEEPAAADSPAPSAGR